MIGLPTAALIFLAGCLAGAAGVYALWAKRLQQALTRQSETAERERLLTERAAGAERALEAERENAKKILGEFRLLASSVLQEVRQEGVEDIRASRMLIEQSVSDMKSRLFDTETKIAEFQKTRSSLEGQFLQALESVAAAAQDVRRETASLKQAMTSSSGVRGSFGQAYLEQILEQSGLVKGQHYDTQVSLGSAEEGELRPDFVVFLPHDRKLAIDAKEVAAEYFRSLETEDESLRRSHLEKLVQNIRDNFVRLSRKDYAARLDGQVPFTLMFVSNEAALRAALATEPGLFEEARLRRIYLTSPMTLVPMVQLIRLALQQQTLADNAQELGRVVEELGSRLFTFMQRLQSLRKSLASSVDCWDDAIGSWNSRVTPQLERVRELGGKLKDAPELPPIGKNPRSAEKSAELPPVSR